MTVIAFSTSPGSEFTQKYVEGLATMASKLRR